MCESKSEKENENGGEEEKVRGQRSNDLTSRKWMKKWEAKLLQHEKLSKNNK